MKKNKKNEKMKAPKMVAFGLLGIIALFSFGVAFSCGISIDQILGIGTVSMGSVSLAVAGIAATGTITTETLNEEGIALQDVSSLVTKIRPDDVPLDTLLREIGRGDKAAALDTSFYQSTMRNNELEIANPFTGDTNFGAKDITLTSVNFVGVDDVIKCNDTLGVDGRSLVIHVVEKNNSTKTISCIAVNGEKDPINEGFTKMPSLGAGEKMFIIGTAKDELAAKTGSFQMMPIKDNNYCQTFMTQVSESVYAEMSKKEINFGLLEFKADAIFDFRMKSNMSAMFGCKAKLIDPITNKEKYFMGGINDFLGLRLSYEVNPAAGSGLGLDGKRLIEIGKAIFSDVNGSDSRVWLCGSTAMASLMKNAEFQKQVESKNTVMKWGITFNEIETGFGKVYLKHDKSMNYCGHGADILSIDPTKIRKRDFLPMQWRKLDLQSTGQQRSNDWVLEEAFTLEVRNPNCHALITGVGVV